MGLSACTDPYDPGQRGDSVGGLFGAATGVPSGASLERPWSATGALIGGDWGAVGGAATTPGYYEYGYNGIWLITGISKRTSYYGPVRNQLLWI